MGLLLQVDRLAKRYGRLPHEILELSPWEISLAIECANQADATSAQMIERIRNQPGGMIFPVVTVGGH